MIGRANEEVHQISSPETLGNTTVQMMVYVHDIDSHYAHAVRRESNHHDAIAGRLLR